MQVPEAITHAITDEETLRLELGDRVLEHLVVIILVDAQPSGEATT